MPSLDLFAEAGFARTPWGIGAAAPEGRPRLALVDPSRLRRDCLKLAMRGAGWHVIDMPAIRDLLGRLWRGERFAAVLVGGASDSEILVEELARLAAAAARTPILVAADCRDRRHAGRLRAAGACDVLPADTGLGMLVTALAQLRAGALPPPDLARADKPSAPRALTRRQREVLALVSQGKSNRLIAAALTLSEDTVKVHVKEIIKRLGVKNRTQAALIATGAAFPQPRAL